MSELQKEFAMLEENCKKIDNYFDTDSECLEYCESKIDSLNEEVDTLERDFNTFSDIIRGYDNYYGCFREYVINIFGSFKLFILFEVVAYLISLIVIFSTNDLIFRIIFIGLLFIITLYNYVVFKKVDKMKTDIWNNIYKKYDIDLNTMNEEEIEEIDLKSLRNRIRINKIENEIYEYRYYLCWKKGRM